MLEDGTEASPALEPDVTADSSTAPDVTAESSTATTENEAPPSLLDVMKNVLEPKVEAAEESSTPEAEKTEPAAEGQGETVKAEEPDNFDGLSFGKHPRFKEILEQRNTARARIQELEPLSQEVERLKGPAEQYERIDAFMRQNGLTGPEVVDLYKFGALSKSDPHKALEVIQPILTDLWKRTGLILPEDLKSEVEDGKITETRARELAEQRSRADTATARAEAAAERAETVQETTAQERLRGAIAAKVVDWEASKKGKDPDYSAKEDLIADRCAAIMAQKGRPETPEQMIALLDQAHADVTERLLRVMPKKPEIRKPPTGGTSTTSTAVPDSLRQALEIAAAQGR